MKLRSSRASFSATYNLPPGFYSVHVDLRYEDFVIDSFYSSAIHFLNPVFQFNFTLPSGICERDISSKDGYWTSSRVPYISPSFMLGAQLNMTILLEELRYNLVDCVLADDAFLTRSARNHSILIFGDSQGRHLTSSLVEFMDNIKFKFSGNDRAIHSNDGVNFVYDPYSHCFLGEHNSYKLRCPADFSRLTSKSDVLLLNFGQWQVGWPENPPWSISHYLDKVNATIARAIASFPSKRIVWLTIHPHGEFYSLPQREWRNDVVLKEYNDRAVELCLKYGYEFVDIFRVANAVHDLSYDGSHYISPVEREIVRVLLHSLFA